MNNNQHTLRERIRAIQAAHYVMSGYWRSSDDVATDALEQLVRDEVTNGRLIELDLLEQAINAGRDMSTFKLQRLEKLLAQRKEPQDG